MTTRRHTARLIPVAVALTLIAGACTAEAETQTREEATTSDAYSDTSGMTSRPAESSTAYLLATPVPGLRAAPQVACATDGSSLAIYRAEGPAGDVDTGEITGVRVAAMARSLDAVLDRPAIGDGSIPSDADPGTAATIEIDGVPVAFYERTIPGGSGYVSRVATWIADGHRINVTVVETEVDLEAVVRSVAPVPSGRFDAVAAPDPSWYP